MPLNIDFQQIFLHLLNFAILSAGLYILLYKPVSDFIAKREEYYKKMDADAHEALEQAENTKKSYEDQLADIDTEIAKRRAAASDAAEKAAAASKEEAQREAEKILSSARTAAQVEHDKMINEANQEIARLAAEAAQKVLETSLDSAYDGFFQAVEGGSVNGEQQ